MTGIGAVLGLLKAQHLGEARIDQRGCSPGVDDEVIDLALDFHGGDDQRCAIAFDDLQVDRRRAAGLGDAFAIRGSDGRLPVATAAVTESAD